MKKSTMISIVVCAVLMVAMTAAAQQAASPAALPKVTIAGSEVRTIKSTNTGRNYDIYIHLPTDYTKDASKKYPIVYILDGQWDFKLMDAVLGGLIYDKFVPQMILVGISYSGENPDYDGLRAMDFTPVAQPKTKGSGDAPKFYAFLKSELIPYVEKNYRGDPQQRVLMGQSLGGLFTLYAMLTDPSLFSRYMAASPAVTSGDRYVFKQEAEFAKNHKELPVKLYMGVGSDEAFTAPVKEIMQAMDSRRYNGLTREFRVFEPERHVSGKPELYNRGLRFLFAQ